MIFFSFSFSLLYPHRLIFNLCIQKLIFNLINLPEVNYLFIFIFARVENYNLIKLASLLLILVFVRGLILGDDI